MCNTPTMTAISGFLTGLAQEYIIFSGDVKSTTIAIAITSSLCCSIVWLVVHLVSGEQPEKEITKKSNNHSNSSSHSNRVSMVTFHLRRSNSMKKKISTPSLRSTPRQLSVPANPRYDCDKVNVICISCGTQTAHWTCRLILCEACCRSSKFTQCDLGHPDIDGRVKGGGRDKPSEVDLSYFNLLACPGRIGYLGAQLSSLNLSNNCLTSLPQEIGFLLGLTELYLQYNSLSELPESIGNLSKLAEFDIKHNELTSIPDSVGQLTSLKYLNLGNNLLTTLPYSIGCLVQLEELSACCNNLTHLPDGLCYMIKLTALYVSENPLVALPSSIGYLVRLQELDVSGCKLEELPHSLSECRALVKLWLTDNKLTSLPEHIGQLHQLKELYVKNNNIPHFPASLACLDLYSFGAIQNPLVDEWDMVRLSFEHPRTPSLPVPLTELCARVISKHDLSWKKENLPLDLKVMLGQKQYCSSCEVPVFENFVSELTFHIFNVSQRVPLHTNLCETCLSRKIQQKAGVTLQS